MLTVKDSLSDIDEKILEYDNLISYQKNEILKTTTLIDNFQECLSRQNEALNSFVSEKFKLQSVKNNCIKKNELNETFPILESNNYCHPSPVKDIIENNVEETIINPEDDNHLKRKLSNGDVDLRERKIICLRDSNSKLDIFETPIAEVQNNTIFAIFVFGNDIYIGGSNGMLLRHTPEYTHVYETNTTDDIRQIAVLKDGDKLSINVFTKNKLIIYEDVQWFTQRNEIDIPGIETIFIDDDLSVYIPFHGGLIKRLPNNILKKAPTITKSVRCFIPCYGKSKLALIGFADLNLYTTLKNEPRDFRLIKSLSNVIGVRRLMNQYFVCYSTKTLWLLNSAFSIIHTLKFDVGIVFVEVFEGFVVVIDGVNDVHLYSLVKERCLNPKLLYRENVNGKITSVSFVNNYVYIAVGKEIVIIKYNY